MHEYLYLANFLTTYRHKEIEMKRELFLTEECLDIKEEPFFDTDDIAVPSAVYHSMNLSLSASIFFLKLDNGRVFSTLCRFFCIP